MKKRVKIVISTGTLTITISTGRSRGMKGVAKEPLVCFIVVYVAKKEKSRANRARLCLNFVSCVASSYPERGLHSGVFLPYTPQESLIFTGYVK